MRMHNGALLSMSPHSLRAAVGPTPFHNPNKTSIARQFVAALNSDDEARSERVPGRHGDRAAKRRAQRAARRPSPTTVAVSDLVSHQQLLCGPLIKGRITCCTPSVRLPICPSLRLFVRLFEKLWTVRIWRERIFLMAAHS